MAEITSKLLINLYGEEEECSICREPHQRVAIVDGPPGTLDESLAVCEGCAGLIYTTFRTPLSEEARALVESVARDIQQADSTNLNLIREVLADDRSVDLLAEYVCGDRIIPPLPSTPEILFVEPEPGTITRICAGCLRYDGVWDRSGYQCGDPRACYEWIARHRK